MSTDVNIPKVGKLPKSVLIAVGVGAAGFIGWKYWQASKGTGADAGTVADGEFGAVDSSIPGVLGAVSPTNSYGDGGNTTDTGGTGPGRFTNNAQWTDYVVGKLSQSDQWSYTDIVVAIGNGIAGKPTTTMQQDILKAAVAIGGQPPEGAIVIVPGGNTGILVAPTNAHLQSVGTDSAVIAFNTVPGAVRYTVYRSGGGSSSVGVGSTSPITISGLSPNTSYTMTVAAQNAAGTDGPNSNSVSVKTAPLSLAKPNTPTIVKITGDAVVVNTGAIPHAGLYRWFLNGKSISTTAFAGATIAPLPRKTKYTVTVRAEAAGQPPGPTSNGKVFTTK
jgi:hypothetical protein